VTEEEAADGAGDMGLVLDDCDAAFASFHARIWSACSPSPRHGGSHTRATTSLSGPAVASRPIRWPACAGQHPCWPLQFSFARVRFTTSRTRIAGGKGEESWPDLAKEVALPSGRRERRSSGGVGERAVPLLPCSSSSTSAA
jgi:hypothetical protein